MDIERLCRQMDGQAQAVRALVSDVDDEQAHWRPDDGSWSLLEVVNHLWDEEREDFRVHLELILFRPGAPWPPIDPVGWVTSRHYNERDLTQSVEALLAARADSLAWLQGLQAPDWDAVCEAPFGPISAGDVMGAWVAHDLLHIRQLVELRWAHTSTVAVSPYDVAYAGPWETPRTAEQPV